MDEVPEWSGVFWESALGTTAIMSIHVADKRHHRPPEGWSLSFTLPPDDFGSDCETFIYRRIT